MNSSALTNNNIINDSSKQHSAAPSATTTTTTTTTSTSTVADYDRFELLCAKGSPYSERIRWALQLLQVDDYALLKHEACAGELYLRYKVGRWNPWHRVTVPVAFVTYAKKGNSKDEQSRLLILEDGLDIVEWANDVAHQRDRMTLIPSSTRTEVLDYCSIADETMEYLRGVFLEKLHQHPTSIKRFMEQDKLPPDFILPWLVNMSYYFMHVKYRSTLQEKEKKRQSIEANLQRVEQQIQEKQQHQQQQQTNAGCSCHLVGNELTLADLYITVAIDATVSIDDVDHDDDLNIKTKYPVLHNWAVEMSKKFHRYVN
jgi:glutathione S-transferase